VLNAEKADQQAAMKKSNPILLLVKGNCHSRFLPFS